MDMDKETVAILIAQNGLNTGAIILGSSIAKLKKQLDKAKTDEEKAAIQKQIDRKDKLAQLLSAADAGVKDYMGGSPF